MSHLYGAVNPSDLKESSDSTFKTIFYFAQFNIMIR